MHAAAVLHEEKEEEEMRRMFPLLLLFVFGVSSALAPAITVSPLSISKKLSLSGQMDLFFYVTGEGGDEPILADLSVSGDARDMISFNQIFVKVEPNETKRVDFHVNPPKTTGIHDGRIRISVAGEQVNWVDISFDVSRLLGKFIVESMSQGSLVENFTVFVYEESKLVFEGTSEGNYVVTDYFDYGDYTVVVKSQGYVDSTKMLNLNSTERVLAFEMEPLPQRDLSIYPSSLMVQGCEQEGALSVLTVYNSGKEDESINISYPANLVSLSNSSFILKPSVSEEVSISFYPQYFGNYSFFINISYGDVLSMVHVTFQVMSYSSCRGREIFRNISFTERMFVHRNFIRYVPVYLNISDYLGSLSLEILGKSSVEVFPRTYMNVNPGDQLVFLLKIFDPRDENLILRFSSTYGTAVYSLSISTKDILDMDMVFAELDDVKSLFEFLKQKALDNAVMGKDMEQPLLSINSALISFDQISDVLSTDPVSAKQSLDTFASQLPTIMGVVYYQELYYSPPYFLLIFLVIIPLAIFFFRMKRAEAETKTKKEI
jgi:hypothetical protein